MGRQTRKWSSKMTIFVSFARRYYNQPMTSPTSQANYSSDRGYRPTGQAYTMLSRMYLSVSQAFLYRLLPTDPSYLCPTTLNAAFKGTMGFAPRPIQSTVGAILAACSPPLFSPSRLFFVLILLQPCGANQTRTDDRWKATNVNLQSYKLSFNIFPTQERSHKRNHVDTDSIRRIREFMRVRLINNMHIHYTTNQ